jgi:selenocysteine lyase/cysteine desulfurase
VWYVTQSVAECRGRIVPAGVVEPAETRSGALREGTEFGTAGRGGADRGGLRASPHFYNTPEEVDRLVSAVSDI